MAYGFSILCRKDSPQWILEGDIKGCFDNISHKWIEENIPMDAKILKQFMKCGYVYDNELYPTTDGTPQGGIISPTLANMTLDGMENLIKQKYWSNTKGTISVKNNEKKVHLIKYADDGGGSAEIAIQVEVSNYFKVLWTKAMVLSVKEKAVQNCQVRIKEMNDQVNH